MTYNEAIARADALRPNILPEDEKGRWLTELEARLLRELGEEPPEKLWPDCGDDELSASAGYDRLYVLWLCAMIDMSIKDYENWNASALAFNSLMDDYKKQCLRDKAPAPRQARGVWRRGV